jgi:putative nucleotidyltransferase with HDIG domain
VVLFTFYLQLFRKEFFEKSRSIAMLYFLIIIYPLLVFLVSKHGPFTVYALPFAMAPVFVRVFMDSRTAFMTILTIVLLCSPFVTFQYEFIIIQIVTGIVAIYSLRELSKRSQMFNTAIWVTLASVAIYYTLQYLQSNDQAKMMDQITYRDFLVSGFLLLFAYPLMLLVEKAFGFTSAVTLFELSNSNHPLMRRLSEVAPGTYQHSVMVGNLAAEIANRVGADSLLVRTGALYHDIGKLENPVFFTENQNTVNPHEKMTRQESAQILISHVTEGLKQAEKYNLPKEIKDFIRTHHGAGLTKFFYISYKNEHPDEEVDKAIFSYPGPNPFTLEQAILMMSDAVEAASRSLNEYTEESIVNLTNRIIDSLVNDGFFKDCPITFRDIAVAKQTLIGRLKSIYHTRISYPEMKKDES